MRPKKRGPINIPAWVVLTDEGVPIVCGGIPFIVPLFKEDGWHYAHEEGKRFCHEMGGLDT